MSANTSLSLAASPSFGSAGPSGSPAPGGPGGAPPKGPKPVSPDKATRLWRNLHYPQEIWWAIACFIAVIAVFQFASWALAKYRSRRGVKSTSAAEAEAGGAPAAVRRFAWRNVPSAVINAWRVAAFRCTLNIGQSYTLNLAEVFVTCAYIIALFTWEFINSMWLGSMVVMLRAHTSVYSDEPDYGKEVGPAIHGQQGRRHRFEPAASRHRPWNEEQRHLMCVHTAPSIVASYIL